MFSACPVAIITSRLYSMWVFSPDDKGTELSSVAVCWCCCCFLPCDMACCFAICKLLRELFRALFILLVAFRLLVAAACETSPAILATFDELFSDWATLFSSRACREPRLL